MRPKAGNLYFVYYCLNCDKNKVIEFGGMDLAKIIEMYMNRYRNIINILIFTFISVALLIFSWIVDFNDTGISHIIPQDFMLDKDISTTFLTSLVGVFLTVTIFTFTTTLTVLNKYSSDFTPRVVQDFIDKPFVLSLFGIFIGGFFYSIFAILMIQNIEGDKKVIAGTIGILYVLASVVYFILFVITVLTSIRVADVMDGIYNKAISLIEKDFQSHESEYEKLSTKEPLDIRSHCSGYLYSVDNAGLLKLIEEAGGSIYIESRIGDYLIEGKIIGKFYAGEADLKDADELLEKIAGTFIYSEELNDKEDYQHEIKNLVEIALRAISPGINDPNTAILAIRKISIILGLLFSSKGNLTVIEGQGDSRIVCNSFVPKDVLYDTFHQLIHYGKEDPSVAIAMLNSIKLIYVKSKSKYREEIKEFYDSVYDGCFSSMETDLDRNKLESLKNNFYNSI